MATDPFRINQDGRRYPAAGSNITFGTDVTGRDFVTPIARFTFYNNVGDAPGDTPIIYIKMPGQFNSTMTQNWQESANIFGMPGSGDEANVLGALNRIFEGASSALQAQIIRGIAGASGALASAGLGGRSQIEFLSRRFLNNFQQLIYQGPIFRRFQLPFTMKPASDDEAIKMLAIIHTFRVASSPNAGFTDEDASALGAGIRDRNTALADSFVDSDEAAQAEQIASGIQTQDQTIAEDLLTPYDVISFSYPDMCKFEILLHFPDGTLSDPLFKSDMCVIESVAIDYGAQNKMQFFRRASDGGYYPTEVNLSISLRETKLQTAGDASLQYDVHRQTIL